MLENKKDSSDKTLYNSKLFQNLVLFLHQKSKEIVFDSLYISLMNLYYFLKSFFQKYNFRN